MNHKQKLGYMALGAGVLAIGIIIGQVITPDIEAQSNGVFDEIQCTRLTVVDKQGNVAVLLATDEHGGVVGVYGKDGGSAGMGIGEHSGFVRVHRKDGGRASMTTNEHGGFVGVFDGKDGGSVGMGIGEHSGFVGVYRKDGGRASMTTNEHGGFVGVANNQCKNRAVMGINEFGNGAVSTWDKNGYRQ